jgi:hypothetical protein
MAWHKKICPLSIFNFSMRILFKKVNSTLDSKHSVAYTVIAAIPPLIILINVILREIQR